MSEFDTQYGAVADQLTDVMGETVSYTPAGGDATDITGMFSEDEDALDYGDDEKAAVRRGTLTIYADADNGIVSPAEGDAVSIRGETWYVDGKPSTTTFHRLSVILYERQEVSGGMKRVIRR